MPNELIEIAEPQLPADWKYNDSVRVGKQLIGRWKDITVEMAGHFWIAREMISRHGGDRRSEKYQRGKSPVDKTWGDYCQEVSGIPNKDTARRAFNHLLSRWFEPKQLPSPVTPPLPVGLFSVIVLDPPWPYGTVYNADTRRVASPYPEMGLDELGALRIPSADNCILWLWATNAFMHDAYHLLEAWEFESKTILTWFKGELDEKTQDYTVKTGIGFWLRGQTEHCILAVKGKPQITHKAQGTALFAKATTHSTKPDEFYELIESLCPGEKLEMFARKPRKGWMVWGLDVSG